MNTAEAFIKLLEKDCVDFIFGHPGEQILPFYKSLKDSKINHILTRHEQGAAHAADAYARSSGSYGVCISTAGPGAMNLVMGVSTSFKDSVPLLVITGDNEYSTKDTDIFQSFPINGVFENIAVKSFHPSSGKLAIFNLVESLIILHKQPKGPIHINLSKDVLLEEVDFKSISFAELFKSFDEDYFDFGLVSENNLSFKDVFGESIGDIYNNDFKLGKLYSHFDFFYKLIFTDISGDLYNKFVEFSKLGFDDIHIIVEEIINKLKVAEKPLIIAGNGVVWGKAIEKLSEFVRKTHVPIATTFHSKGVIDEDCKFNLGLVGLRGSCVANYAYEYSDLILVLGAKLSERTIAKGNFNDISNKIIHVNIDSNSFKGNINIPLDVFSFLDLLGDFTDYRIDTSWIDEIYSNFYPLIVGGIDDLEENYSPLKPQYVINKILVAFKGSYVLSDAGSHTTWTTLLSTNNSFGKLLFSGGFGPMGYGIPAAIGVAIAHPNDNVVVICGDGDIQMVIQELSTIVEYNLNISIFIINNSQLSIIRQWEEMVYGFENYEVDLINPDFTKIAEAYGIDSMLVNSRDDLKIAINKSLNSDKSFLADIHVVKENIPLPK